jgi:ribonucleoside-diphosphate reductase subunit M1
MHVIKRNNEKQDVHFDKITERIKRLVAPSELDDEQFIHLKTKDEVRYIDPVIIAQKVVASLYPGMTTEELDLESANICVNMSTKHPSYALLGGRILVSNLHKKTLERFSDKMTVLYQNTNNIDKEWYEYIMSNKDAIDCMIDYNRDYMYDYFGFKTLEKSYLMKVNNKIVERPQDIYMRVASTLQQGDLTMIKKTYDLMSLGLYTHASPTMYNCGIIKKQLSSCFLLGTYDSLEEITKTWNSCAQISKWSGGIGLHVSNIRGKNSIINGTGGKSNGIVPFLRVFNDIARWIDQGGKRPGAIAIFLEPHHPDIFEFLDLRKNFGAETERARDLFLSLWISDLFMKQVDSDGDWYLMSADTCPGLPDVYGDQFEELYWSYVEQKKYVQVVKARKLWMAIMDAQIETGTPYIGFKDAINKKCNQKNLGTIKSSNLCHEITEYSDHNEYAVCNLGSIPINQCIAPFDNSKEFIIYTKPECKYSMWAKLYMNNNNIKYKEKQYNQVNLNELRQYVDNVSFPLIFTSEMTHIGGWTELYKYTASSYDYNKLYDIAYTATVNLDKVIDINYYPVPQAKLSNMKHRPIGLGIQGLADALVQLRLPFESDEAVEFNAKIMETIYLASITASNDIAKSRLNGMSRLCDILRNFKYPEFYDSSYIHMNEEINELYHKLRPNKYELRHSHLHNTTLGAYSSFEGSPFSQGIFQHDMWNVEPFYKEEWVKLRDSVMKYGTRNSLLTALMPTANTSQILGNNECFEFFTNNIYSRKTSAGEFPLVNKFLVQDLLNIGLWDNDMKDMILAASGSIQNIDSIPLQFKQLYKTIWEIKQVWVLKAAKARGAFVDQTQSMNIFMSEPDYQRLGSSHFWAWRNGLKTGIYYLRSKPSTDAIKFTIDPKLVKNNNTINPVDESELLCNPVCGSCSA